MAVLKIVTEEENEEFLRKKSREVSEITPRIKTLLDDMVETMRHANGCGLAAVQVGVLRRVVVMDVGDGLLELINPEITKVEGEQIGEEGCLSLPGLCGMVKRPKVVQVKAQNREGKWCLYKGEDLKARCFCHELDHLDGVLYKDNLLEGTTLQRVGEIEEVE
jgi:peptide deformylase